MYAEEDRLGAVRNVGQPPDPGENQPIDHGEPRHGAGAASADRSATPLAEPGPGAFAALSEAVATLAADPDTDWSRVDVAGLREHLL